MSVVPEDAAGTTRTVWVDEARAQVTVPLGTPLAEAERALILATLRHCGGVRRRAADLLGISLKTLYNRLVAYRVPGAGRAAANPRPEIRHAP